MAEGMSPITYQYICQITEPDLREGPITVLLIDEYPANYLPAEGNRCCGRYGEAVSSTSP